jgi:hypothetical protein
VIRVEAAGGEALEIVENTRLLSYRAPGPADPALAETSLLRRPPSQVAIRGAFARLR